MVPKPTTEKWLRFEPATLAEARSVLGGIHDVKSLTYLCHQFTSAKRLQQYARGEGDRDWQALKEEA